MNEVTVINRAAADVDAYRASTEAADMCKEIVVATSSTIQNRRYVAVEGWQAIAIAHGCALSARGVERVEGGVKAVGEVRRMSDGQLIATAEGFVGEDEPTWYGGEAEVWDKQARAKVKKVLPKRADYAIRAMAQTRAMSRAGRTAFAHVVVMMNAGLATTPAEEMIAIDGETGEIIEAPAREKVPGIHKIKERLRTLQEDGDKAQTLDDFNALIAQHRTDLKTLRDANHEWWTGDGEDLEGFAAWKERRKAELSRTDSTALQLLLSLIQEAQTSDDLRSIVDEHEQTIAGLEGEESRRFDLAFNNRETDLATPVQPTPLTEGAFGG